MSKSSARTVTQLLKLRSHETTANHARHAAARSSYRVHFCSWFLQPVIEGEIDPQLTFFSDEAWFRLQGYINTQNNRCWNLQNPHLTHEVKVGVWCAVSARRIVVPVLF
jgi:hypothetical protein